MPQKTTQFEHSLGFTPDVSGNSEFRAHRNRGRSISFVNGELVTHQTQESSGLSSRAIDKGLYGFAAHPDMNRQGADFVMNQARKNVGVLSAHSKNGSSLNFTSGSAQVFQEILHRQKAWSNKELIERLKELDELIASHSPFVKSRRLMLREQTFAKEIWTGLGGHCDFSYSRCHLYYVLTAESDHGPVEVMAVVGGRGFVEDIFPSKDQFKENLEKHIQYLKEKTTGIYPSPGKHTVILDSKLAGILAHEAVGHTTEADIVRGGSVAGDLLGEEVASPLVSLVDFAHSYNGIQCPVPVFHDDECTEASDTVIIEKGKLRAFMNSQETSTLYEQPATGHARAWGFSDEPLIRMRNTAILPGTSTLEEMISSVESGYYLIDHSNGQADSTSEFMFGVTLGYEIKDGKLGRPLLDTTISGVAFDMLRSVSMVSNEMTWVDSGTCGKKQPMYVGMGGPAIKCELTIGGQ